jgi:hypothetical protein
MVDITGVVGGNDKARIDNDHDKMTLNSIDNGIDLLAEPLISFWVILRLKVLNAPSPGVCIGPRQVGPDGFVNHFPHGLAGQSRLSLQSSVDRLVNVSNRSIHSVQCNTSILTIQPRLIRLCLRGFLCTTPCRNPPRLPFVDLLRPRAPKMVFAGVGRMRKFKSFKEFKPFKLLRQIELFERIEPLEQMSVGGLHGDKTF